MRNLYVLLSRVRLARGARHRFRVPGSPAPTRADRPRRRALRPGARRAPSASLAPARAIARASGPCRALLPRFVTLSRARPSTRLPPRCPSARRRTGRGPRRSCTSAAHFNLPKRPERRTLSCNALAHEQHVREHLQSQLLQPIIARLPAVPPSGGASKPV